MSKKVNVQGYLNSIRAPWGRLFYELIWHNIECSGKRILDFGSGFGYTADHLAKYNHVVAVEPNKEMLEYRFSDHDYEQINGGIEVLKTMPAQSFDVIVCHNVLEYMDNREEVLAEFKRLLKADGYISVIKHNRAGKIMQKAVFENNVDEALKLLAHEDVESVYFGMVNAYEDYQLEEYAKGMLEIDKIYGLRIFYALQKNEFKTGDEWFSKMYDLECKAGEIPEFRDIAFSHHIILSHAPVSMPYKGFFSRSFQ